jgi:hypothetical protein
MYTIIDESTNKVLFAKFDSEVLEGQVAIDKVCTIERENPFESEIFYNFETEQFYIK